jgi:hypothetical protein
MIRVALRRNVGVTVWACALVLSAGVTMPLQAQQAAGAPEPAPLAPPDAAPPAGVEPAEPAGAAAATPATGVSRVTFVNHQPGVTMYLVTPKLKVYLCQKECTLELRQAPYQVGLGMPGDDVLPADAPLTVGEGPQVVETAYVSRADLRRTGLLVLGVGVALSVATLVTGIYITAQADSPSAETVGIASVTGGAAGLAISSVVGLIMALREDEAHAVLRPADR